MPQKEQLTKEALRSEFKNNFELANYAIRLATHYVKSGHEVSVDELLEEIRLHPHQYTTAELEEMDAADDKNEAQH